ncbi:MAG: folylpolyglutamate synthase/dihydrofolate synthase family protein [Thermoanaerobaculia bacterium]|nr:folylpolyglutamate synthase/dihydrofolate synthase family protein [Thermoanaerobaculia bacterium]
MPSAATRLASRLATLEQFGVKLGLERIESLLAALGDPHHRLPVVLVAGTNGKGSAAATLSSIVTAAGYRSGLYTSPHLEAVEERIRFDGVEIDTAALADLVDEVMEAAGRLGDDRPTYFETLTAAALLGFERQAVDLAVLEVGMGGRLDATNVCRPLLSIITSIGLDHQEQLGRTATAIAREKAGILRPDRPALALRGEAAVQRVLEQRAAEIGTRLELVSVQSLLTARELRPGRGQRLELESAQGTYRLETRLEGSHQTENVALAVLAAERLAALGFGAVDSAAIERGVAAVRWPGRLEWVVLADGTEVLLDAAHNGAGWEALQRYLDELDRPFDLLFGVLRDKAGAGGVGSFVERASRLVLSTPPSERALPATDLAAQIDRPSAVEPDPARALARALDTDRLLVVSGSLFLIGAVRRELRRSFGGPERQRQLFSSP